jgi:hypothetical protein
MCGGEKPLKVKVLNNKSSAYRGHIHYDGKIYKTGEVLDIKDKDYDPKIFMKIAESSKKEETVPILAEEPIVTVTSKEFPTEESKPKKTRRKI